MSEPPATGGVTPVHVFGVRGSSCPFDDRLHQKGAKLPIPLTERLTGGLQM